MFEAVLGFIHVYSIQLHQKSLYGPSYHARPQFSECFQIEFCG